MVRVVGRIFLGRSVGKIIIESFRVDSSKNKIMSITAKNPVISPNFRVWKFCGKAQVPHSFGRFARNYAEHVSFHRISTPEN